MMNISIRLSLLFLISFLLLSCSSNRTSNSKVGPQSGVAGLAKSIESDKDEAKVSEKESETPVSKSKASADNNLDSDTDNKISSTNLTTQNVDVTGSWVLKVTFPGAGSVLRVDLRLKQNGENLTVYAKSDVGGNRGVWKREPNGKMKNNKITLFLKKKAKEQLTQEQSKTEQ